MKDRQRLFQDKIENIIDKRLLGSRAELQFSEMAITVDFLADPALDSTSIVGGATLAAPGVPARSIEINSRGAGLIDSLVNGLRSTCGVMYPSLDNITLSNYQATGFHDTRFGSGRSYVMDLVIFGSTGNRLYFSGTSNSLIKASIMAVKETFQFLIDCERTVATLRECIKDADARHRADVRTELVSELTEVVLVTNFNRKDG